MGCDPDGELPPDEGLEHHTLFQQGLIDRDGLGSFGQPGCSDLGVDQLVHVLRGKGGFCCCDRSGQRIDARGDIAPLLHQQALVFQDPSRVLVGGVQAHLVLVVEALPGGLFDGDIASIPVEDGETERDPQAAGVEPRGVTGPGQPQVEGWELGQHGLAESLFLALVPRLKGQQVWPTPTKLHHALPDDTLIQIGQLDPAGEVKARAGGEPQQGIEILPTRMDPTVQFVDLGANVLQLDEVSRDRVQGDITRVQSFLQPGVPGGYQRLLLLQHR